MNKLHPCPHAPFCCASDEGAETLFIEANEYFLKKGVNISPLRKGSPSHWRTRAKLAVRGTVDQPLIGLFKPGTHEVVEIPNCIAHHPKINEAVAVLKQFIQNQRIVPYNESSHKGDLRYVQLAVERKSGKVQLVLVSNNPQPNVKQLYNPELWHSIWVNTNTRKDNVIFGKEWNLIVGEQFLWENYLDTEVAFLPQSFAQANPEMFTRLLGALKNQIEPNTDLVEYYAGVGVIGLVLADKCKSVLCSEIYPDGKICFEASLNKLPFHGERIRYHVGAAADLLNLLPQGNAILVDPPRKGLDQKLLHALEKTEDKTLYYISCGWESFKRDCDQLLQAGWQLQSAEVFLFFPGSPHIETLAVFKKR